MKKQKIDENTPKLVSSKREQNTMVLVSQLGVATFLCGRNLDPSLSLFHTL